MKDFMHQHNLVPVVPGELEIGICLILQFQDLLAIIGQLYKMIDAIKKIIK